MEALIEGDQLICLNPATGQRWAAPLSTAPLRPQPSLLGFCPDGSHVALQVSPIDLFDGTAYAELQVFSIAGDDHGGYVLQRVGREAKAASASQPWWAYHPRRMSGPWQFHHRGDGYRREEAALSGLSSFDMLFALMGTDAAAVRSFGTDGLYHTYGLVTLPYQQHASVHRVCTDGRPSGSQKMHAALVAKLLRMPVRHHLGALWGLGSFNEPSSAANNGAMRWTPDGLGFNFWAKDGQNHVLHGFDFVHATVVVPKGLSAEPLGPTAGQNVRLRLAGLDIYRMVDPKHRLYVLMLAAVWSMVQHGALGARPDDVKLCMMLREVLTLSVLYYAAGVGAAIVSKWYKRDDAPFVCAERLDLTAAAAVF